ncbi:SDR family NAD(P)-dependent oxidoreductase [Bailinhaonella thermotolerans]|uniref:SDR family oxidoreductase n=1 Tax=Bailinhaonella thermotolerans TaxID=1070861 RepID=A0A3A4ABK8_9ACTN|nr:SDR family oxidoreductase [Bailinhaonella thermotolerans]RJL22933.1 SDR family oxidoreductase [Bailinhaonella thermotolerans]
MDLNLAGKTAVVTAASGGIGGAVVRTLIAEGARVLGADRVVSDELKRSGAVTVEADLLTDDGVDGLRWAAESEFGHVDLLVNGVGGLAGLDLGGLPDLADETWRRAFELNFFSGVRITRALLPLLRESVVNVSTSVAHWPASGPHWYGASKAALTAFGKGLADELGPRGIRVNTVSPALIRTPLWDEYGPRVSQARGGDFQRLMSDLPDQINVTLGRWGTPQEVANVIVFLSSPAAAYVTGSDYVIDGGLLKVL